MLVKAFLESSWFSIGEYLTVLLLDPLEVQAILIGALEQRIIVLRRRIITCTGPSLSRLLQLGLLYRFLFKPAMTSASSLTSFISLILSGDGVVGKETLSPGGLQSFL